VAPPVPAQARCNTAAIGPVIAAGVVIRVRTYVLAIGAVDAPASAKESDDHG